MAEEILDIDHVIANPSTAASRSRQVVVVLY